ncbi:protein FAM210B%2C mitochondrial [Scomber scombrus]|uniref:Protein FAM210B, mitochondrial n=1 Tax=Scomber scombrus TaxID=13677 RepID=A0AAV1N196_SCOSC|nr:protein FAM210B, mitochondrial [Scomber scombrus]
MFQCGAARRCAAALDQAYKSPGSFLLQVKANTLTDVTLTLRKRNNTLQGYRSLCVGSTLAHLRKQRPGPVQTWDPSSGFRIPDWRNLDRAVNLSRSVQSEGFHSDVSRLPIVHAIRRHSSSRGGQLGSVLFTGNWGLSTFSPRCSTGTMTQSRASSTDANKRDAAAEGQTVDSNNKGDEQNLKEASTTTSSSTVKHPGEPEPEGGNLNKTQQLKKVFKEYGAVGVSFHIGISLMSLGMFYLLVSSGIDMAGLLCKLGFNETVVQSKMAAGTSTFVLAYAIHKLFAPVRISITLVSVPLIVRYFRKTGLFKPPTPAP